MKCVIIYNPQAGKLRGRGSERLQCARRILIEAGHETILVPTSGPGDAATLARRWVADRAGLIVAAGGDGTVNEVAEGMVHSAVPLGILPAGTANVLAMETGMSRNLEIAARELLTATPERISVGHLHFGNRSPGSRHFLLMAGIGFDARVIYNLSAPLKTNFGKIAYWIAAFTLMGRRLEEFAVKIDERDYRCSFALVSKVRNYGGDLQIARDTSLFDDRFEVVLFSGENSVRYLHYFAGVVLNRLQGMQGGEHPPGPSASAVSGPGYSRLHAGGWRIRGPSSGLHRHCKRCDYTAPPGSLQRTRQTKRIAPEYGVVPLFPPPRFPAGEDQGGGAARMPRRLGECVAFALHPHPSVTRLAPKPASLAPLDLPRGKTRGRKVRKSGFGMLVSQTVSERFNDRVHYSVDVLHHIDIPESQYSKPLLLEEFRPSLVVGNIVGVLRTINLDYQPLLYAAEINDESFDRVLATEAGAIQILKSQMRPESHFRIGWFLAKLA